jgi:protein phosphatase
MRLGAMMWGGKAVAVSVAGFSEIGPRSSNEDSWATWLAGSTFFAAVADGLGGMPGGGQASGYVIDYLKRHAVDAGTTAEWLADLALECHEGLQRLQVRYPDHASMATTVTVMGVSGRTLVAAHCGDTRLYVVRGGTLSQLSEDHSEAQRLFNEGLLSREAFIHYPRKHILDSALGIPDKPAIQQIEFEVETGDWLLIASDGAYNKFDPAEVIGVAKISRSPEDFAATCRRQVEANGPGDNYTMIVARIDA